MGRLPGRQSSFRDHLTGTDNGAYPHKNKISLCKIRKNMTFLPGGLIYEGFIYIKESIILCDNNHSIKNSYKLLSRRETGVDFDSIR
jgi:hypothetical protein